MKRLLVSLSLYCDNMVGRPETRNAFEQLEKLKTNSNFCVHFSWHSKSFDQDCFAKATVVQDHFAYFIENLLLKLTWSVQLP